MRAMSGISGISEINETSRIIRKTEDNLITIGNGVMLFGVWTLLKSILTFIIFGSELDETLPFAVKAVATVIIWAVILLDTGGRIYIGYAARCEGRREKKLPYLGFTGFLLLVYIIAVILEIVLLVTLAEEIVYMLIVLVIDVTSLIFLLQLMINSVKIRRLRKQEAGNGERYEF